MGVWKHETETMRVCMECVLLRDPASPKWKSRGNGRLDSMYTDTNHWILIPNTLVSYAYVRLNAKAYVTHTKTKEDIW